mmetsp:Transcript_37439/g.79411  ORF Transcript_37439/g.79411 Transcript_37439/m.79411 type:complete len:754 (-) Transcript_37439:67-2328(-)
MPPNHHLAPALLFVSASIALSVDPTLDLLVETGDGAFTVTLDEKPWLVGNDYRVGALSSAEGSLHLLSTTLGSGKDEFGDYDAITLDWGAQAKDKDSLMQTTFRRYPKDRSMFVFEQYFPKTLNLTALLGGSNLSAGTVFPGFSKSKSRGKLPCLSFHDIFAVPKQSTLGGYVSSELGGTPLIIWDNVVEDLPMLVLSPLSNVMAQQMTADKSDLLGVGVKATVETIPAGWRQLFLVSAGRGINDGMMKWGDRMLKYSGRPIVDNRYKDAVHGSIGYWTDNGGYYHYSLGDNKSLGKNYEEVLPKVKAYHDSLGVPFKHWQFDSWFYPKDGKPDPGGGGPGVTNWTSMPSVFPHGMAYIQSLLKVPMAMHNRHWSPHSDYIKHWPDIEWYISKHAAIPKNPKKFFDRFFTQQKGWGLSMYEQDWMTDEYHKATALKTNISMGDLWLKGMADGATGASLTVQYCMPLPGMVLAAASHPAVTNVRASTDYSLADDQWAIGTTGLFYWALNILPFKDGFYSSTIFQHGGQYPRAEKQPDREALIATLSAAMVGPMDGVNYLNVSRVMATCRKDGLILKPDRPATTTDQCFRELNSSCQVYHTYSDIKGFSRVHYYYNDDKSKPFRASEVYLKPDADYAVYNWYTGEVFDLNASLPLRAGYEDHIYAVVVPKINGLVYLGEVDKYVSLSSTRFAAITSSGGLLQVSMRGVPGETVRTCNAVPPAPMKCQEMTFPKSEDTLVVRFAADGSLAPETIVV